METTERWISTARTPANNHRKKYQSTLRGKDVRGSHWHCTVIPYSILSPSADCSFRSIHVNLLYLHLLTMIILR